MPNCKTCNTYFSGNKKLPDGSKQNVRRRLHCEECRPPRVRQPPVVGTTLTQCTTCPRQYVYDLSKGHRSDQCNSCVINHRRHFLKEQAVAYKGGCCQRCGYSKCIEALTFHHIDPTQKEFSLSGNHSRSWAKIKVELDKCLLLCQNCHTEVHVEMREAERAGHPINTEVPNQNSDAPFQTIYRRTPPKPQKHCACGAEIFQQSEQCMKCFSETRETIGWPPDEELVVLMSQIPMVQVARRIGCSDNAIRKHCEKHGIPFPTRQSRKSGPESPT